MGEFDSLGLEERCRAFLDSDIFGRLDDDVLDRVASNSTERRFGKGEIVFSEGDPGDSVAIVFSGELSVWSGQPPKVVRILGPGNAVGELAALIGEARSATVTASRPTVLLEIESELFRELCQSEARLMEQVSRLVAQRLATAHSSSSGTDSYTVVVVGSERGLSGAGLVASGVASMAAQITGARQLLIRLEPPDSDGRSARDQNLLEQLGQLPLEDLRSRVEHPEGVGDLGVLTAFAAQLGGSDARRSLDLIIAKLGPGCRLVVVEVGVATNNSLESVARLADTVIRVVSAASGLGGDQSGRDQDAISGPRQIEVLNLFNQGTSPVAVHEMQPFVLPVDEGLVGVRFPGQVDHINDHPLAPGPRVLGRLTRCVLGSTVGIALGGGAAFGIAHVGVLQVLDRAGIPVDLVAGTSMGSIVGAGYAAGLPTDEMAEIAVRLGTSARTILSAVNLHPLRPGLLSADRLEGIFTPFLGNNRDFEQLVVPFRAVTTDIERGERVCIKSGSVSEAFRASASIPMLVAPSRKDGRVLVDGAVVDPVPAGVVREMGSDLCLSVNVVPQPRLGVSTSVSRLAGRAAELNPLAIFRRGQAGPNIVDLAMNTIQALQFELGDFKAIGADVRINPDLADMTWIEFWRAPELIERGQEAAERALPAIRSALSRRLSAE